MNVAELLKPLVEKSMKLKGYSREAAVEKAHVWLAKELHVPHVVLYNLNDEQQWHAHAVVEKALVPPPKKHKKKIEMPEAPGRSGAEMPLGAAFWDRLKAEWGDAFFNAFFGDFTPVKVEGTLAPGQYAIDEIKKVNRTALFDAA